MTAPWRRRAPRRALSAGLHLLTWLAGGPPPGLRRGAGRTPTDAPTVAVVLVRTSPEAVGRVLGALAEDRASIDRLTPVFLVDEPVLPPFRQAGYVVELVGPSGLAAAVREMRLTYACSSFVVVDGGSPASCERLAVILDAVRPAEQRGPVETTRRLFRRLEGWVDARAG